MKEKTTSTQKALNLWAIVLIVWSIYRASIKMPEWFDEFIAKPIVFILPVYYYIRKIDKKNFFADIYLDLKKILPDFLLGLVIAVFFIVSAFLANWLKAGKLFLKPQPNVCLLLFTIALAIATAISEEVLSRGFVLKRLYQESKNIYTSSFFASLLFFFLHVPMLFTSNNIFGGLLLTFMVTDILLSLIISFIFIQRKSLTLPILIHAFYNLIIILFI